MWSAIRFRTGGESVQNHINSLLSVTSVSDEGNLRQCDHQGVYVTRVMGLMGIVREFAGVGEG